jgi:hypothetical protein
MVFSMKMKSDKIIKAYDNLAEQGKIKNSFWAYARINGFEKASKVKGVFDPYKSALTEEVKNWKKNKGVELSDTFDSPNGKELLISTRVTDFPSFEISGVKYSVAQVDEKFVFIEDDKIISYAPSPKGMGSGSVYGLDKGVINEGNLFLIGAVHVNAVRGWAGRNCHMVKVNLTSGKFDFSHLDSFEYNNGVDKFIKNPASELELHRIPDNGKPFKRVFDSETESFGEPISSKENVFGDIWSSFYKK